MVISRCGSCSRPTWYYRSMCGTLALFLLIFLLWYHSPTLNSVIRSAHSAFGMTLTSVLGNGNFSAAICSPHIFRDYYATRDYFPGNGRWVTDSADDTTATLEHNVASKAKMSTNQTQVGRYVPDICNFRYGGRRNPLPPEAVLRCFSARNISSVATIGDSNAVRYFGAIVRLLNQAGNGSRCTKVALGKVKSILPMPGVRYFARHNQQLLPYIRAEGRMCTACSSRASRCLLDDNDDKWRNLNSENKPAWHDDGDTQSRERRNQKWIDVECMTTTSVLDNSFKINIPQNEACTYQEFLFKHYLKDRYPDLLLIFPPFNHEKERTSLASRLQRFINLVDLHVPSTTRVIWIPTFSEFEAKKPPLWKNRRFGGLLATAKINQLNHVLYRSIRSQLLNVPNHSDSRTSNGRSVMGFLDQIRVSSTRLDLSIDGVHMASEWYDEISSYILQMFCSDVIAAD